MRLRPSLSCLILAASLTACSEVTEPPPAETEFSAARASRGSVVDFRVIQLPFNAAAVNERGDIVGGNKLWRRGEVISIGINGTDINNRGQVIGGRFLWHKGRTTDLGTLGGTQTMAHAINDRGQVVGLSEDGSGELQPFIWKNGRMEKLATTGLAGWTVGEAVPTAISNSGLVVGWVELDELAPRGGLPQAVAWEHGELRFFGGTFSAGEHSEAHDTNGKASVGYALTGQGNFSVQNAAILWSDGSHDVLPRLDPPRFGQSYATAINQRGDVVGHQDPDPNFDIGVSAPLLWRHGQPIDLRAPGVDPETVPTDINNRGWIVGGSTLWIPTGGRP